ncbi:unnamed protein product [Cylicocyclus nassatus]|uniref:Uncharacterized protein n=1 Tax=Cylicocyclus nassatus TaxID=53992 RepID=A0AA36GJT8_CYLNA|nr:unnamed protein product [Cylicocyclus nassatus]
MKMLNSLFVTSARCVAENCLFMDERHSPQQKMSGITVDTRADFWKLRIVRQPCSTTKVYLFPSLLEWLDERPQLALNEALARKESQLGLDIPKEVTSVNRSESHNVDILTLYVSGRSDTRPSSKDILNHLQRTYVELYKREGQNRSRDLISLIDASLLLNEPEFAWKLSQENNYEHDLLELLDRNISSKDKWDNYVTSLMLRLSSCGAPSEEVWEAATVTRLLCQIMAGPTCRRRAAIAEMAAVGLKVDAMVLAKLYLTDDEICEQLSRECSCLLNKSMTSEVDEISRMVDMASAPIFNRDMLRCIDQLSCYRILRIDFALNENESLERKLIGRMKLAQHVRFVIADALAYRNFADLEFIAEDAASHLDKFSFFSGLEQIVYPVGFQNYH